MTKRQYEKHGMTKTSEHRAWAGMKTRCHNPKDTAYKYYGAKGIRVCIRWKNSFTNFYKDMGPKPKYHELDRKNNNGNYTPKNCRWITHKENCKNRCNSIIWVIRGKKFKSSREAAEYFKVDHKTIQHWCKGGTYKSGKKYGPKPGCYFIPKYPDKD